MILTQRIDTNVSDNFDVVILMEPVKRIEVYMHSFNFEAGLKYQLSDQLDKKIKVTIKFPEILLKLKEQFLLDNVCMTSKTKTMILFYDCQIHFIKVPSGEVNFRKDFTRHDIGLDYFLSPTNLPSNVFNKLTPIENTDSLLAMSNLGQLVYIEIDQAKIANKIVTDLTDKFESFKLNKSLVCAYTKIKQAIFFYNLNSLRKKKSFPPAFVYEISLASINSPLSFYGFSTNNTYFYMIENNRDLKFHKLEADLKSTRLLGEFNMYHTVASVTCGEEFICLSMNDQKFVSFLIADPDDEARSLHKIKALPSRFVFENV